MRCALCQEERELRNSHILSEFLYKPLYDEKHKFHALSIDPAKNSYKPQKGLRERLLCHDCESKLGKWERYASHVLKGGAALSIAKVGNAVEVNGIDYEKFKLFQLSILWRASVSSLDFFSGIDLGEDEDRIRAMLFNENPGHENHYGCCLYGLQHEGKPFSDLILQPRRELHHNRTCYKFVFGSFMWLFFEGATPDDSPLSEGFLKSSGRAVFLIKPVAELQYIKNFWLELHRLGRA